MRCSRTEAPSLHRRYPASPVLQASPPPCAARPDPRGLSVGACHATGRASRVASVPLFHACCRHYPGGAGRCLRRSLPDPWQPSPLNRRVGFRIIGFEACTAFRTLRPAWSLSRPRRPFGVEVLQTMSLPPPSAPTVTGWSDSCRAGFAPAEEQRLFTAHCSASTTLATRVASFRNVTHRPQKDRTASPARDRPVPGHPTGPGAVARQHRREVCRPPPRELSSPRRRAPRWRSRRPPRAVRNRMSPSPSPSGTGHRSLNLNVTSPGLRPGAREGEPQARRCRSRVSVPSSAVERWPGRSARPVGRRHAQASRAGQRPGRTEPPRGDRTPGRSGVAAGGKCAGHRRVSCPGPRRRAPCWRSRRPPRAVREPGVAVAVGHRTPVTEPQRHFPRSATGGAGGRAAGEAMPFPRQRSVVGR